MSDNPFKLHPAEFLRARSVDRWVMVEVSKPQNLAEHTFNVIALAAHIAEIEGYAHNIDDVVRYALIHDIEEVVTGDIPTPVKPYVHEMVDRMAGRMRYGGACRHTFSDEVIRIVKQADMLEACLYLQWYGLGSHAKDIQSGILDKMSEETQTLYWEILSHDHRTFRDFIGEIENAARARRKAS